MDVGIHRRPPAGKCGVGWVSDPMSFVRHPRAGATCTTVPVDPRDDPLKKQQGNSFCKALASFYKDIFSSTLFAGLT